MELDITIIEKLKELLSKITLLKKRISLFAVIQREGVDTWDLVVGGDDLRTKENLDLIIKITKKIFEQDEIIRFPRLILLNSNHPLLDSINRAFAVEDGAVKIENTKIDNIFLKNAYLLYSKNLGYPTKKEKYEVEEENVKIKDTASSSTTQ
ncbi:MAG: hypothetical protein HQ538_02635 [Parcubacteria group bacterium]|nr:hypothetical protein [Parcubacteria group bacterium]